ncbi:hypothetical protein NIES2098_02470 [Calothrix sp. NIES-2098]|nr:hypothetical protein NIES2098_02470 [Calothrix sp. NIES-2098]
MSLLNVLNLSPAALMQLQPHEVESSIASGTDNRYSIFGYSRDSLLPLQDICIDVL